MAITRLYDINYDPASPDYVGGVSPPGAIKKLDENQKQIFSEFNNYLGDGTLRLPFSQTPIYVNGQDLMSRTFYVDAVNGDDNNPGTSGAPFKTLEKAIDSVPVGGYGVIRLKDDQTHYALSNWWLFIYNKKINIERTNDGTNKPKLIFKSWASFRNYFPFFQGKNYVIEFRSIEIADELSDPNLEVFSDWGIFGREVYDQIIVNFLYCDINLQKAKLVSTRNHVRFLVCAFYKCNYNFSPIQISLDYGATAAIVAYNTTFTDGEGNPAGLGDILSGVIKDANGIPRNVISNVIL